jgi:hypothetical protein
MTNNDPLCICDHTFSVHKRVTREARSDMEIFIQPRATRPDIDINTGGPLGQSGCTECDCNQWRPRA